jgi:hypothetical protein
MFSLLHFWILPQHVSASHCHHQGVVVSLTATQAVCIVDVCGLRPTGVVICRGDVTKRVHAWLHPYTCTSTYFSFITEVLETIFIF